ncbi:MAG: helicase-related protein, partial [Alphaproteobacteria bacterium]
MTPASPHGGRITAVLGPTNTGKTHLAIERMLGHASGMIGFPLRLLARENYDRIVKLRGPRAVALVTGEEKIVPPRPSYFVCTVESMPLDRPVEFLAVDEVQLAADPERGHVFTDRLLHARGMSETMFLGADTVRGLIRRLVPEAEFVTRPRFSKLTYSGPRKLTRLPRRGAVVAFSAAEVYRVAELLRRQHGGVAVILGALSPRTRNAQVGMYQAGEVDYLVATDAIGMGLNMDLDHVAFAGLRKFDGRGWRDLAAAELAQIAGRAGRHMSDGTFGIDAALGALAPELVAAIENHEFAPVRAFNWRNRALDFTSIAALRDSLAAPPEVAGLVRARDADDQRALVRLGERAEIAERARAPAAIRLLWNVCQIPDFRDAMGDGHVQLLARVFRYLTSAEGRLPADWVARHVARLDRTGGDIDTLMERIAHVRTWTYIAHRADWLEDASHWQERARTLEDRLSDALHERLLQRFVDRRAATLVRRLRDGGVLAAVIRESDADGEDEVLVEGQYVGRLSGFRFRADPAAVGADVRPVLAAANQALRREMPARAARFCAETDAAFDWGADLRINWRGVAVARLLPGRDALAPRLDLLADDFLEPVQRARLHRRLSEWLAARLRRDLTPLFRLRADGAGAAPKVNGAARGLLFQLGEGLGSVPREAVEDQVRALDDR